MIVRKRMRLGPVFRRSWKGTLFVAVYATAFVGLYETGATTFTIPVGIPAMLGTALSILLGFRTNSAYGRWWEARKIWGGIVNDSRTLTRQVTTIFRAPADRAPEDMAKAQRELVYGQIAFNYMLARSLRGQDPFTDVRQMLPPAEIEQLKVHDNRPNAILQMQGERLSAALRAGYLDSIQFLPIDRTLTRMCDYMGKCERIKNTVFPTHYGLLVSGIILIFFVLLPPGLVASLGWITAPVAFAIATIFWLIEGMSAAMQDPFENAVSDTPMLALSRTIEINLREQLRETDVPEKIQPEDGVLM